MAYVVSPVAAAAVAGPEPATIAPDAGAQIAGSSPAIRELLARLRRVATSSVPVLIEGETGSGKELAARAVHYWGPRAAGPFVAVNCGALPDHLLEAELFGHERGAFTDAKSARRGLVAEAEGGSLFLDEVDTLSPRAQVALLRFLQDQHYRPLGSSRESVAHVRVIAASNQSLADAVAAASFRVDLLYRLKILHLQMPPLRQREGDAELLANHFLRLYGAKYALPAKPFDAAALAFIRSHRWPGNVRELENWVQRELLMADESTVSAGAIDPAERDASPAGAMSLAQFHLAKAEAVRSFERDYVLRMLRHTDGNVTRAAQLAGKERRAFGKLLKKHGIDKSMALSG